MTGLLSKTLSRALSGPLNPAPPFAAAITVTGTLTSDGTTPVVFPTLYYAGLSSGAPAYTDTGTQLTKQYVVWKNGGMWYLFDIATDANWQSGVEALTPEAVTGWAPIAPATGTPIITAV